MKMKKLISFLCAAALTVSSFAGLAVTASAETPKSVTVAVDAGDTTANVTTTESSAVTGVLLLAKYSNNALTSLKVSTSFTTPANDVALGAAYADGDKLMAWEDLASMKPITVTRVAKPVPPTVLNTVAQVTITGGTTAGSTLTAAVTAKTGETFEDTDEFTYAWTKDGEAVDGGTDGTLDDVAAGVYAVTATYTGDGNYTGTLTADNYTVTAADDTRTNLSGATVTVTPAGTVYTNTELTAAVTIPGAEEGDDATTVPAADLDYAWSKKGDSDAWTPVADATAATFTPTEAGTYKVTVTAKEASENYVGTKDSAEITVIVPADYVTAANGKIKAVSVTAADAEKTYKQLKIAGTFTEGELKANQRANNVFGGSYTIVEVDATDLVASAATNKIELGFTVPAATYNSEIYTAKLAAPSGSIADLTSTAASALAVSGATNNGWSSKTANTTYAREIQADIAAVAEADSKLLYYVIWTSTTREQNIVDLTLTSKTFRTVTVDSNITGGTVTADKTSNLVAGDKVTVTVAATNGYDYTANSLSVKDASNADVTATAVEGQAGKYEFTMPDSNVTVTAAFTEIQLDPSVITLNYKSGNDTVKTATVNGYIGRAIDLTDKLVGFNIDNDDNATFKHYTIDNGAQTSITPSAATATVDIAVSTNGRDYYYFNDYSVDDSANWTITQADRGRVTIANNKAEFGGIDNMKGSTITSPNWGVTADTYKAEFKLALTGCKGTSSSGAQEAVFTINDGTDGQVLSLKSTAPAGSSDVANVWTIQNAVAANTTVTLATGKEYSYTITRAVAGGTTTSLLTIMDGSTPVVTDVPITIANAGIKNATFAYGRWCPKAVLSEVEVYTYTAPVTPAAKKITWSNELTGFTVKRAGTSGDTVIQTNEELAAGDVIKIEATATDKKVKSVATTPANAFTVENGVATYTVPATPVDVTITAVELEDKTPATQATTATIAAVGADTNLYGKKLADLTNNFAITGTGKAYTATGTLKYVTDYTDFSGNPAEQSGNYLPFVVNVDGYNENSTIKIKGNAAGSAENTYTYADNNDGVFVFILGGVSTSLSIKVDRDGSGAAYEETEYTLSWTKAETAGEADKLYFAPATPTLSGTVTVKVDGDAAAEATTDDTLTADVTGVTASSGTPTLKYQWQKFNTAATENTITVGSFTGAWTDVDGKTAATYATPEVGIYRVVVSADDYDGTVASDAVTVTQSMYRTYDFRTANNGYIDESNSYKEDNAELEQTRGSKDGQNYDINGNGSVVFEKGAYYNNDHGIVVWGGDNKITIAAEGPTKITVGSCQFSAAAKVTLKADGTEVDSATYLNKDSTPTAGTCWTGTDTETNSYVLKYAGSGAATLTIVFDNYVYLPMLRIEKVTMVPVNAENASVAVTPAAPYTAGTALTATATGTAETAAADLTAADFDYKWYAGAEATGTALAETAAYTPTAAGKYTVEATANKFGFTGSVTKTIEVAAAPSKTDVTATVALSSTGDVVTATLSNVDPAAAEESFTYAWKKSTDNGTTWTDIEDVTSASITNAEAKAQYKVTASIPAGNETYAGSATSDAYTLDLTNSWKASGTDLQKTAGHYLMNGLSTLFTDDAGKDQSTTIGEENFTHYITCGTNGSWSEGKAAGTALKYVAAANGTFKIYVVNLNSQKELLITKAGTATSDIKTNTAGVTAYYKNEGEKGSATLSLDVTKGETYYAYVAGSKANFVGAKLDVDKYAVKAINPNDGEATPADTATITLTDGVTNGLAAKDGKVTLTAVPAAGKAVTAVTVTKAGGGTVEVTKEATDNTYSFTMPAEPVTVTATVANVENSAPASITVNGAASVDANSTSTYTATVYDASSNVTSQNGVTWAVYTDAGATTLADKSEISSAGVLSVGADETAETLYIVATSSVSGSEGVKSTAKAVTVNSVYVKQLVSFSRVTDEGTAVTSGYVVATEDEAPNAGFFTASVKTIPAAQTGAAKLAAAIADGKAELYLNPNKTYKLTLKTAEDGAVIAENIAYAPTEAAETTAVNKAVAAATVPDSDALTSAGVTSITPANAIVGDTVEITVPADENAIITSVKVNDTIDATKSESKENTYTVTMPAGGITSVTVNKTPIYNVTLANTANATVKKGDDNFTTSKVPADTAITISGEPAEGYTRTIAITKDEDDSDVKAFVYNSETGVVTVPAYAITITITDTINKYAVTFNVDGGSAVDAQEVEHGGKVTQPATDPTKDNKVFGGWYADEDLTTEFDFDTTITAATTIYAKWNDPAPTTFAVNYTATDVSAIKYADNAEGLAEGTVITETGTAIAAGKVVSVTAATKPDHTATITVKDADDTDVEVTDGVFTMPAKAVTITVTYTATTKWTAFAGTDAANYTIAAADEGDDVVTTLTIKNGKTANFTYDLAADLATVPEAWNAGELTVTYELALPSGFAIPNNWFVDLSTANTRVQSWGGGDTNLFGRTHGFNNGNTLHFVGGSASTADNANIGVITADLRAAKQDGNYYTYTNKVDLKNGKIFAGSTSAETNAPLHSVLMTKTAQTFVPTKLYLNFGVDQAVAADTSVMIKNVSVSYNATPTSYTITKSDAEATYTIDKQTANAGDTVTVTATSGSKITAITVAGAPDAAVVNDGASATFTMPAQNVTVNVTEESAAQTTYTITAANNIEHGSITDITTSPAAAGTSVSFKVSPAEGYQLKDGTVKAAYNDGTTDVDLTVANGGLAYNSDNTTYTFSMPAANVTVSAEFEVVYTVTLNAGTGAYEEGNSKEYVVAEGETLPSDIELPTLSDKVIVGWVASDATGVTLPVSTADLKKLTFENDATYTPVFMKTIVSYDYDATGDGSEFTENRRSGRTTANDPTGEEGDESANKVLKFAAVSNAANEAGYSRIKFADSVLHATSVKVEYDSYIPATQPTDDGGGAQRISLALYDTSLRTDSTWSKGGYPTTGSLFNQGQLGSNGYKVQGTETDDAYDTWVHTEVYVDYLANKLAYKVTKADGTVLKQGADTAYIDGNALYITGFEIYTTVNHNTVYLDNLNVSADFGVSNTITIQYQNTDGATIKDSETDATATNGLSYTVDSGKKNTFDYTNDGVKYRYVYTADGSTDSIDSVGDENKTITLKFNKYAYQDVEFAVSLPENAPEGGKTVPVVVTGTPINDAEASAVNTTVNVTFAEGEKTKTETIQLLNGSYHYAVASTDDWVGAEADFTVDSAKVEKSIELEANNRSRAALTLAYTSDGTASGTKYAETVIYDGATDNKYVGDTAPADEITAKFQKLVRVNNEGDLTYKAYQADASTLPTEGVSLADTSNTVYVKATQVTGTDATAGDVTDFYYFEDFENYAVETGNDGSILGFSGGASSKVKAGNVSGNLLWFRNTGTNDDVWTAKKWDSAKGTNSPITATKIKMEFDMHFGYVGSKTFDWTLKNSAGEAIAYYKYDMGATKVTSVKIKDIEQMATTEDNITFLKDKDNYSEDTTQGHVTIVADFDTDMATITFSRASNTKTFKASIAGLTAENIATAVFNSESNNNGERNCTVDNMKVYAVTTAVAAE